MADNHVKNLASLFVQHNAHRLLGIHLIHGHFNLPQDSILLGKSFKEPRGRWAQITKAPDVNPTTIHGHIFALSKNRLCPYEFQDGPLPDLSEVSSEFLPAFILYITENGLGDLIGLQVLGECNEVSMSELILDNGTVMIQSDVLKGCSPSRVTGWRFENGPEGPRACQANETHSKMTTGNHKVFNAGKPLPKLETIDNLKTALLAVGVL